MNQNSSRNHVESSITASGLPARSKLPENSRWRAVANKLPWLVEGNSHPLLMKYRFYKVAAVAFLAHFGLILSGCAEKEYPLLQEGAVARHAGDFERARSIYVEACADDSGKGCFMLAQMFYTGEGGSQDVGKARELYERSCKESHADGCYNLAGMIDHGEGGAQDSSLARELYKRACNDKQPAGCYNYALFLDEGRGGTANDSAARKYYEKSCRGGIALGCYNLGIMFDTGEGGDFDIQKAVQFYDAACALGNEHACMKSQIIKVMGR